RIIGLPGETIEIKEGKIYINGKKISEKIKTTELENAGIASDPLKLGGNEYFVLGDNRKSSEDSRMADIGAVKKSEIYGKAWLVLSPGKNFGFIK
ncbi:MAG: signal peptidase I, partial [Lachnospiraceae bacterium]|nr:signal peptidase I [Lachnospiraceae bacterium]